MELNNKITEDNPLVFWDEAFTGEAVGGYFVRNDLKNFISLLEKQNLRPVGIKFNGTFNLEIIVEKPKENEQLQDNKTADN